MLLSLPFIAVMTSSKIYRYQFRRSIGFVKNILGFIIGINGPIRVGKTSFQSGLSSICQIITMNNIQELMDKTKMIFKEIDFNEFNSLLIELFPTTDELPDFDQLTIFFLEYYSLDVKGIHYDMLGQISIYKLILDYIQAFWVLVIRNNFVQSKTPFYSHITRNYNMNLETDWLKIREAYQKKNYAIYDWITLLIDELTDEAGAMEYLNDVKDESGGKEYRRKFGQIHQERNRIITTKQDVMDEVKKYRNLTHSNLVIDEKVKIVGNHMWIYNIFEYLLMKRIKTIRFIKIFPRFIWSKLRREGLSLSDIEDEYRNRVGKYRKIENKLYYIKHFFKSIGYNRYYGFIIKRAEDIERSKADRDEFAMYIPTVYCFGTYDTHLYKTMQNELLSKSQVISSEVNSFDEKKYFQKSEAIAQEGVDEYAF